MRTVAVIPARGGSKRLPRKNIHPVLGLPMVGWVIRACQQAQGVNQVYVSTEDAEIADVARQFEVVVIQRPTALAADEVLKQTVIVHAVEALASQGHEADIVISVQPNSPELTGAMLEEGLRKFSAHHLWELFSVDPQLIQNGAFRIMQRTTVFQKTLSAHCGVIIADCLDIHTLEDVAEVEARLMRRKRPLVQEPAGAGKVVRDSKGG